MHPLFVSSFLHYQGWIQSISDIHKSKPAPNVTYSRRMPDIEDLMQEWPPEMETFLRNMKMPSGELVSG